MDLTATSAPTFQPRIFFHISSFQFAEFYSDSQVLWKSDTGRLQVSWMGKKIQIILYLFKSCNYEN